MPDTLILTAADVRALLPMPECIAVMRRAFQALADGTASMPTRTAVDVGAHDARLLLMPAVLQGDSHTDETGPPPDARGPVVWDRPANGEAATSEPPDRWFGAKVLSLFPHNAARGLDSHQGLLVLFDGDTGAVAAVIDAASLTAIRTAAVSGLATQLLARAEASTLAVLGTGVQALSHLAAMVAVRPIREIRLWGRDPDRAAALATRAAADLGLAILVADSPREAVDQADLICAVTASPTPLVEASWIRAGAHVNAVGAHRPTERELDSATIRRARLFVDSRPAALAEAGDLLIPLAESSITLAHLLGDLSDLVSARVPGRMADDDLTVFKSVGLAIEDIAAAAHTYRRARAAGVGTMVRLGNG